MDNKCPFCGSNNIKVGFDGEMFCSDCGEILECCARCSSSNIGTTKNGVKFCRNCGARGEALTSSNQQESKLENQVVPDKTSSDQSHSTEIIPLLCPQCGSADIIKRADGLHYCNSCNTKVIIHDDQIDTSAQEPIEVYGVQRPKYSKEVFLREVLIKLALDSGTPSDIFEKDFIVKENSNKRVMVQYTLSDASYTVSIGNFRIETYTEIEKKQVKYSKYSNRPASSEEISKGEYTTVYVDTPVTKTRTVTDWSPFSGECNKIAIGTALPYDYDEEQDNEDIKAGLKSFSDRFLECWNSKEMGDDQFSEEVIPELKVTKEFEQLLIKEAKNHLAEYVGKTLPGDVFKDLRCDYYNTQHNRIALLYTEYEVDFKLNESKNCSMTAFSFGKPSIFTREKFQEGNDETEQRIWEANKRPLILTALSFCASIAVSVLLKNIWAVAGLFVLSVFMFIFSLKNVNVKTKSIKKDIASYKIKELNKKLSKLGLPKYDSEEE